MIQRIQTVYLLLSSICLWLTFFFDFSIYTVGEQTVPFNLFGFENVQSSMSWFPYNIVIPIIASISVICIFQFKKRTNQLFIVRVMYLLLLLILGFIFYDTSNIFAVLKAGGQSVTIAYGIGLFLTVASLPFVFLANRAIKKDEKLIREADRLR